MKFFSEMTDVELLALTSEQIDDLAKLELVKEGSPLPYAKPEVPKLEDFTPQAACELYEINGAHFQSKEDALAAKEALAKAVNVEHEYMPGSIPNLKIVPDQGFSPTYITDISVVKIFSKAVAKNVKEHLTNKDKMEKPVKEWEKVATEFSDKRAAISEAIYEAMRRQREQAERGIYMEECLRLADNDKMIAQRFFLKRYPEQMDEAAMPTNEEAEF